MQVELKSWMSSGREHGFTYIALLMIVAIMSVGLSVVIDVWQIAIKRERERELLFVGDQFRNALAMYYRSAGPGVRYPTSMEDLIKDPRYPNTRRYLRKVFFDPVTNSLNLGIVNGPSGEILGVYSRSEDEPLKKANFDLADQSFEGKQKYSDWVFTISAANALVPQPIPGPQNVLGNGGMPGLANPLRAPQRR